MILLIYAKMKETVTSGFNFTTSHSKNDKFFIQKKKLKF